MWKRCFQTIVPDLKRQCHENLVLTETVGVYSRLGPTDMPEPLSTAVNCPFTFLW